MIKVYDSNKNFIALLDSCRNLHTTETLDTGLKTLCFQVPCLEKYLEIIQEENYVITADAEYVIKEIKNKTNDFFTVYCSANVEDLTGKLFPIFDCFELSLKQAYEYCVSNSNWAVEYLSKDKSIATYQTKNVNAFEMINSIAEDFNQELWFDTKNKKLKIYDKMGDSLGAYYSNELRLKQLVKQSSSYDYATVLLPIGKDGLTISSVNNGSPYLENFSYTNKYIEKVWVNKEIDIPEKLKMMAEEYLNSIAVPRASYKLTVSELGKNVSLGDEVIIVDNIKRIKQKQRVVKIVRYPASPEKDMLEISNLQVDFTKMFIKNQKNTEKEIKYLKELYKSLK